MTPAGLPWRWAALIVLLPLFGETFTYVVDLPPAYALAKAWPFLTLPFAVAGAAFARPPARVLVLGVLAWMAAVTPLVSMTTLGDSLAGALTGSIKIWPLAGVLALAPLLARMRVGAGTLEAVLHTLGALTFAVMLLLWLTTPSAAYFQGIEGTKVFIWDADRGFRINMPMFFGLFWIFLLGRRLVAGPRLWPALMILVAFVLMVTIYKQRTQILGAGAVLAIGPVLAAARRRGVWLGVLLGGMLAAAPVVYAAGASHDAAAALGGSLTYRQTELAHALAFLNDQPLRWIIGAGGATRAGEVDLAAIVGTNYFFLSDLGWVGVVFEYGLVGAGLMLALHLTALRLGWRGARSGGPVAWALFDYALYLLLVSPVLSVVFAPGELATILALMTVAGQATLARRGAVASESSSTSSARM